MRMGCAMVFVKDLGEMTAFYRDVIGFRPIEETRRDDWVEFDAGGATFALHAIPHHLADAVPASPAAVARESRSCKLIFTTDDPGKERGRLAVAGVTILSRAWGGWDAVDPEGNVFGVCSSKP